MGLTVAPRAGLFNIPALLGARLSDSGGALLSDVGGSGEGSVRLTQPERSSPMFRILTAAALALALAASGAQAQNFDRQSAERALPLILGIATLAIIANQAAKAKDDDDDDDDRVVVRRGDVVTSFAPRHVERPRHAAPAHARADRGRARVVTVPARCARRVQTDEGPLTGFGAPCLRRAGVDLAALPGRCARRVDLGDRAVTGWEARCLRRAGVRIW
jgi:hypothetical protein